MDRQVTYCGNCGWADWSDNVDEQTLLHDESRGCDAQNCTEDHIGRASIGMWIDAYLNVYVVERNAVYGGPEEGGWYKSYIDCVGTIRVKAKFVEDGGHPLLVFANGNTADMCDALCKATGIEPDLQLFKGESHYYPTHYC